MKSTKSFCLYRQVNTPEARRYAHLKDKGQTDSCDTESVDSIDIEEEITQFKQSRAKDVRICILYK